MEEKENDVHREDYMDTMLLSVACTQRFTHTFYSKTYTDCILFCYTVPQAETHMNSKHSDLYTLKMCL